MTNQPKTLADKVWDSHVVRSAPGEPDLLYIDLHLIHEVTSPQAFDGLRMAGRPVRRPDLTIATADHNVPTINIDRPIVDPIEAPSVRHAFTHAYSHVSNKSVEPNDHTAGRNASLADQATLDPTGLEVRNSKRLV